MRKCFITCFWMLLAVVLRAAAPTGTEAVLVIVGDQHSAYERTAQFVARVDRVRAENPRLPVAVLIDGDVFEQGNIVARRSAGEVDFAMFAALARRGPTILNLGNHEPEFYDLAETVERVRATGVTVVSNITNHATGKPFAPMSTTLQLGNREAVVVGLTTDLLATFRVPVRPSLDLANPVVWGKVFLPEALSQSPVKIVLSHAGLAADRELLPIVPDGTLFVGAHDHIRFVHRVGRTTYVHSGSWNEFMTLAYLRFDERGPRWEIEQQPIALAGPADPELAALIRETQAKHLTAEDKTVIAHLARAFTPDEAARFTAEALRAAAKVDVAFVGHTTFGAGLPAGDVTRVAFDACVRFDGTLFVGEVSGERLRGMLAAANESPGTPFAQRRGDFLAAAGPSEIDPQRSYRIAATDWIARNPEKYLGPGKIEFTERPALHVKEIVRAALAGKQ